MKQGQKTHLVVERQLRLARKVPILLRIIAEHQALEQVVDADDAQHPSSMGLVGVRETEDARFGGVDRLEEGAERRGGGEDVFEWEGGVAHFVVVQRVFQKRSE